VANDWMKPIHERMPAILLARQQDLWLDPTSETAAPLHQLLAPCAADRLDRLVNSPHHDGRDRVEPMDL
jgi:putative SOS response-associated peptidase YedK